MTAADTAAVQIAVTGATGRMGQTVLETAAPRADVEVAVAVSRSSVEQVADVPVDDTGSLGGLLDAEPVDVLVDFTGPSSALEYASAAASAGVGVVTGTTGFDDAERTHLREMATQTPVLWATNFSRGVAALRRAVTAAVAAVPGYDVELTETHHNGKRDAPSGTATTLLEDDMLPENRVRSASTRAVPATSPANTRCCSPATTRRSHFHTARGIARCSRPVHSMPPPGLRGASRGGTRSTTSSTEARRERRSHIDE
jgi:4-hydroxy-tetrahydrodipicolinate reductase